MAFICEKCATVSGVSSFEQQIGGRSRGPCECCGITTVCIDSSSYTSLSNGRIGFAYLRGRMENPQEEQFLAVLEQTNRIRYEWGTDGVWVWAGEGEPTESAALYMLGETFHERMALADKSTVSGPTAASFVVDLLARGLNVQIAARKPFKKKNLLKELVASAQEINPTGVGTVMKFKPKRH